MSSGSEAESYGDRYILGIIPFWVAGVLVSLLGSFMTVTGFVLQKQAVQAPGGKKPWPRFGDVVCSPRWWVGFFFVCILPLPGDLIAYALAPASLLAPLSGFTILVNFVVAPRVLGEKLQFGPDLSASLLILTGIIFTTVTGDHGEAATKMDLARLQHLFCHPVFVVAFVCLLVVILAGLACTIIFKSRIEASAKERPANPPFHHMLLPAMLYAGFGCLVNIGLKAISELLTSGVSILIPAAVGIPIALTACLQLNFLNRGLRLYLQVLFIPTAAALLVVTNTLYSAVFFQEYKTFESSPTKAVFFCVGILLIVIGINMFQLRKGKTVVVVLESVVSTVVDASKNEDSTGKDSECGDSTVTVVDASNDEPSTGTTMTISTDYEAARCKCIETILYSFCPFVSSRACIEIKDIGGRHN